MTTTRNVASAKRQTRSTLVLLACAAGSLVLAGCGTGTNLLSQTTPSENTQIVGNLPAAATAPVTRQTTMALAPVIGAPEVVSTQITTQLTSSLSQRNVNVVANGQPSDYTLRGYVVAAKERVGTKVSYIWDITDPQGKRVNRISGEEVISGANTRDPWTAVSAPVVATIVNKTASEIGNWLPAQAPAAPTTEDRVASAATAVAGSAATAAAPRVPAAAGTAVRNAAATASTVTGALPSRGTLAVNPSVIGAPGDGSTSLAAALSRELAGNGVTLTSTPTPAAFRINGKVAVGAESGGKQPIRIDWTVRDANGSNVGTVTQKNEIPAGSLDGAWGQTADAAATAAAQGILRLMKQNSATN